VILGIILGIFFKENLNPFQKVEKNQKIISFLQLSLIIAIISFISSFIRISFFELYSGLILSLILVNCPLLLILLRKKEEKIGHLIIFISGFLIIAFMVYSLILLIDPISGGKSGERLTMFPPLSFPLIATHKEIIVFPPPGPGSNVYYNSFFNIGVFLPFLNIQFPMEFHWVNYDMIANQRIFETVALPNQVLYFLLFFALNFAMTLSTLKIITKWEKRIDFNRGLNTTCRSTILLVNILYTAFNVAGVLPYFIYRFYGDIQIDTISLFSILMIIIISVGLILRFYKYPFLQESYQRYTKELLVIGLIGFLSLVIVLIIETIWPSDIYLVYSMVFGIIIIGIIAILLTLLMMHYPVFPKQNAILEEINTSS